VSLPGGPMWPGGTPRYAAATDVGLIRTNNEDAYLAAPPLFAVADGMGGHRAGEVASAGAIRALKEEVGHDTDSLVAAVHAANRAVYAQASQNPDLAGMGTTITALLATADGAQIVHVGDSRAYLLRDERLRRLTQDHTVVERLAREGKIPADDVDHHPQRSVLERALGVGPEVDVDVRLLDVHLGDRLLLCTDGLTTMLEDEEIQAILLEENEPDAASRRLVAEALKAGGKDNVTAVVVDFPPSGPRTGAAPGAGTTAEQPVVVVGSGPSQRGGPRRRPSFGDTTAIHAPGPRSTTPRLSRPSSGARPVASPGPHEASGAHLHHGDGDGGGAPDPALRGGGNRSRGTRLIIGGAVVLPLLAIGVVAAVLAIRSSWYVGQRSGRVAVFRGVPGSFAGIELSSLAVGTDIPTASLPSVYQRRLRDGITANGRKDAVRTVENLRQLELPSDSSLPPGATPSGSASPGGSPSAPGPSAPGPSAPGPASGGPAVR
jgi:serine/threonine protein phosphatase PrpC